MAGSLETPSRAAPEVQPLEGLRFQLRSRIGQLEVEAALSLERETLVLVGPNGAGKTSLLKLLLGLEPVREGRLVAQGVELFDSRRGLNLPPEARRLGYVPQEYGLFPHLTVRGNLEFAVGSARSAPWRAPWSQSARSASRREALRIDKLLDELGLQRLAQRHPPQLSGGEKQRVALARALAIEPRALLLDEPLSALDLPARREVRGLLAAYLRRLPLPTILVTHDPAEARAFGDRIAVMEKGALTACCTWEELTQRPPTPFTREFLGL